VHQEQLVRSGVSLFGVSLFGVSLFGVSLFGVSPFLPYSPVFSKKPFFFALNLCMLHTCILTLNVNRTVKTTK